MFLGFVTPPLLALDAYKRARNRNLAIWHPIAACLVSLASIASFFIGYVRNADCTAFAYSHPAAYLAFVTTMLSGFLAARGFYFSVVSGGIVLTILIGIAVSQLKYVGHRHTQNRDLGTVALAFVAFSLLFSAGTAAGRICIESGSGQTSRYMIYMVPAFLAIYFYTLTLYGGARTWSITTLLVLSLLASFPTGVAHKGTMQKARLVWKNCYLKLEDVGRCDEITNFTIYPPPEAATHLQEKLLFLKQHQLNLYAR